VIPGAVEIPGHHLRLTGGGQRLLDHGQFMPPYVGHATGNPPGGSIRARGATHVRPGTGAAFTGHARGWTMAAALLAGAMAAAPGNRRHPARTNDPTLRRLLGVAAGAALAARAVLPALLGAALLTLALALLVLTGELPGGLWAVLGLAGQLAVSAAVLGGYLILAVRAA
jgi:hypothetical protein